MEPFRNGVGGVGGWGGWGWRWWWWRGGKHTQAHMQIKAINSLWWSETSWRKQSVPLPWKPLSPHRPRETGKKTQRAKETRREWQKNSNRQTDIKELFKTFFRHFPLPATDTLYIYSTPSNQEWVEYRVKAGWTFVGLMSTSEALQRNTHKIQNQLELITTCIFCIALKSPIYDNKACCRRLNIATWSYDIRQAFGRDDCKAKRYSRYVL